MESATPILFNRPRLRKRHARAATTAMQHDFLWQEAAARAEESLSFIARRFERMLVFGGRHFTPPAGTREVIHAAATQGAPPFTLIADEECLPFADNSMDAIVCLLNLHWVNDLPGTMVQCRRILKPDGLFLAMMPGGETLRELRSIFAATESAQRGGISPRIAPFIDVRDAGALLQRAGFALPVADSELLDISYPDMFALMGDLRGSGEVNMLHAQPQHFTPRGFFMEAAARYASAHSDSEGRIHATMEFITLSGWKPAANQQQPAARGSGTTSLRDALN
jgi:NADH dehydrogenase [ubiquinone] 1 alpha subcomplex assembly factor 5